MFTREALSSLDMDMLARVLAEGAGDLSAVAQQDYAAYLIMIFQAGTMGERELLAALKKRRRNIEHVAIAG